VSFFIIFNNKQSRYRLTSSFLTSLCGDFYQVSQSPNSPHAIAIHENIQFYTEFLLPIIRSYCQMKGWEQVPVLVLGEAGVPIPGQDFSDYPRYEPFALQNQGKVKNKKSSSKPSKAHPMVLNIV
jgi:formylmethanofuran dehydrogenase subunit B